MKTEFRPGKARTLIVWGCACSIVQCALTAEKVVTFELLGDLPGGQYFSTANDVSADGSVVVGESRSENGDQAFRWENGVMNGLGDLPGGQFQSEANGISADGSVIVGGTFHIVPGNIFEDYAYCWEDGVVTKLDDLPGGTSACVAVGISNDGEIIVGSSNSEMGSEACYWKDGDVTGLGDLPGGAFLSEAMCVSDDGFRNSELQRILVGCTFLQKESYKERKFGNDGR